MSVLGLLFFCFLLLFFPLGYVFISWVTITSNRAIGLMSRVFPNRPGDRVSIPGRVIPKTQKMVLDAALLNTQHYKVRVKGKVEQSKKWIRPPTPRCSSS